MRKQIVTIVLAALLPLGARGGRPRPQRSATRTVPTEPGSPWPSMRHDRRNTGASPLRGRYHAGDRPWRFRTGKGVFSTP